MPDEKCRFYIRDEDGGEDCGKPAVKLLAYNDALPRWLCQSCADYVQAELDKRELCNRYAVPMGPVGEKVMQCPGSTFDPDRKIHISTFGCGLQHQGCSDMHRIRVTETMTALVCPKCYLKIYVPANIETWAQLFTWRQKEPQDRFYNS